MNDVSLCVKVKSAKSTEGRASCFNAPSEEKIIRRAYGSVENPTYGNLR